MRKREEESIYEEMFVRASLSLLFHLHGGLCNIATQRELALCDVLTATPREAHGGGERQQNRRDFHMFASRLSVSNSLVLYIIEKKAFTKLNQRL